MARHPIPLVENPDIVDPWLNPRGDQIKDLGGYTSTEVCQLAGISYRQLDHWTRLGVVIPSVADGIGSGSSRGYALSDVRLVILIAWLRRDVGVGLEKLREVLAEAGDEHMMLERVEPQ